MVERTQVSETAMDKVYIVWHVGYDEIEGVFGSKAAAQHYLDLLYEASPNNVLYLRPRHAISEHEVKK